MLTYQEDITEAEQYPLADIDVIQVFPHLQKQQQSAPKNENEECLIGHKLVQTSDVKDNSITRDRELHTNHSQMAVSSRKRASVQNHEFSNDNLYNLAQTNTNPQSAISEEDTEGDADTDADTDMTDNGNDSMRNLVPPSKKRLVDNGSRNASPVDVFKPVELHIQDTNGFNYNNIPQVPNNNGLMTADELLLPLPSPSASPVQSGDDSQITGQDKDKKDKDEDFNNISNDSIASNRNFKYGQVIKLPENETELTGLLMNMLDMIPNKSTSITPLLWKLLQNTDRSTLTVVADALKESLRKDIITVIPTEVAMKIFSYLDYDSLKKTSEVSKSWLKLSNQCFEFWKQLLFDDGLMQNRKEFDGEFQWIANQLHGYNNSEIARILYKRRRMIANRWKNPNFHPRKVILGSESDYIQLGVVTCLQFDDDKVIAGSDNFYILIYDTLTGSLRNCLSGHKGGVWAMKYSGNTLASGSTDHTVRIWNIKQGKCTYVFKGHTSTVRCLDIIEPAQIGVDDEGRPKFYPPTPLLVTGSRDSTLYIWELPVTGEDDELPDEPIELYEQNNMFLLNVLRGHAGPIRAVSGYADTLVSMSYDGTGRVWDLRTGDCKFILNGHGDRIYTTALDIKRNRCISGSSDTTVRIWDLTDGENICVLEGHSALVGLITLSDNYLVSAAADSTIRVWDPETGKQKHILRGHTGAITCVQHDDNLVISGSNRMLKVWDIKSGEFVRDLIEEVDGGVWQVKFDHRRCIAALQKDRTTYIEMLDFGVDVCNGLVDSRSPPANIVNCGFNSIVNNIHNNNHNHTNLLNMEHAQAGAVQGDEIMIFEDDEMAA